MSNNTAVFNRTIRAWMAYRGLTTGTLAKRAGISSQQVLSGRLTGRSEWRFEEVLNVAAALDVPISDLIEGLGGEADSVERMTWDFVLPGQGLAAQEV